MQEPESLDGAERELAEALGSLQPAPIRTSPREIWYEAGFRVGRRQTNTWRAIAATVSLFAGTMLVWTTRPARTPGANVVQVTQESHPTGYVPAIQEPLSVSSATNLRLRNDVIERGWDSLPPARSKAEFQSLRAGPLHF